MLATLSRITLARICHRKPGRCPHPLETPRFHGLIHYRGSIFKAVQMLHDYGVCHCDLHEGNIRYDPKTNKAWIIDFELAEPHKCKAQKIKWARDMPETQPIRCFELWTMAHRTEVRINYGESSSLRLRFASIDPFFGINKGSGDMIPSLSTLGPYQLGKISYRTLGYFSRRSKPWQKLKRHLSRCRNSKVSCFGFLLAWLSDRSPRAISSGVQKEESDFLHGKPIV